MYRNMTEAIHKTLSPIIVKGLVLDQKIIVILRWYTIN